MKTNPKKPLSKSKGAALLAEVLIAFLILLFVALGAIAFYVTEKKSIFHSAEMSQGANLARSIMESYIYGKPFDSLTSVTDNNYAAANSANQNYIYNITASPFSENIKLLTIKLYTNPNTRSPGLGRNMVELETFVYKNRQ